LSGFTAKIKRGDTTFYTFLRRLAHFYMQPELPLPRFLLPLARLFYYLHFGIWSGFRTMLVVFYNVPLFRGRCESAGRRLYVFLLPHVSGPTRIHVGDNLKIFGKIGITSGRIHDHPTLIIKDNVTIGHMVAFSVNQEIVVEDDVYIAGWVRISDNDGHSLDPDLRKAGLPPQLSEIRPVRICRNAWLGEGCYIRKGVTIGEGAIIGANSVVLSNIAPYCIAVGTPAKVVGFAEPKGDRGKTD
jgi:acetyltransferase-like isoleucine patch superfamily enzyme